METRSCEYLHFSLCQNIFCLFQPLWSPSCQRTYPLYSVQGSPFFLSQPVSDLPRQREPLLQKHLLRERKKPAFPPSLFILHFQSVGRESLSSPFYRRSRGGVGRRALIPGHWQRERERRAEGFSGELRVIFDRERKTPGWFPPHVTERCNALRVCQRRVRVRHPL